MRPEDEFRAAIASTSMEPPHEIHADGRLHRFSPTGKRGDDAGWYVLRVDGVPAGSFGNWRDGFSQCWRARSEREMLPSERKALAKRIEAMHRQRNTEQHHRQAEAAAAAAVRWTAGVAAPDSHAYLAKKGVRAYRLRAEGSGLLVPMHCIEGRLHSLQTISPSGEKRFLPGGRVRGCYYSVGRPSGRIVVCEGVATGHTIHSQTEHAVACAFSAGNLLPVAQALRSKWRCLDLVIAADDDWCTDGNPGVAAAVEAARAVGGRLAIPNFTGLPRDNNTTDWNDWARLRQLCGAGGMTL